MKKKKEQRQPDGTGQEELAIAKGTLKDKKNKPLNPLKLLHVQNSGNGFF